MRNVQGQNRNCETSVVTHTLVELTDQIIIHQRWTPTSRLTMHVLSSFIEHPNPFLNHVIHSSHCHYTHDRHGDESHLVAHS